MTKDKNGDNSGKNKIIDLMEEARKRGKVPPGREPGASIKSQDQVIIGSGNIQAGRDLTVKTEKILQRTTAITKPGLEHIADDQAFVLKGLVEEIVTLEAKLRKSPKSYGAVYGGMNKHVGATSYRLIKIERFEKAEKYLRQWIGRLSSAKSAPKKDKNWRNRKYSYIHTNIKQLGLEPRLREHLAKRFGVESLKELNDDDLASVYTLVAGWKKQPPKS